MGFRLSVWVAAGAALLAGCADQPDYQRELSPAPSVVYAAFSALGREGSETAMTGEVKGKLTRRIVKRHNESLGLDILYNDEVMLAAELQFVAAPDGSGTVLTGEAEFVNGPFRSFIDANLPQQGNYSIKHAALDEKFREWLDEMAERIEDGRSLPSFALAGAPLSARAVRGFGMGGPTGPGTTAGVAPRGTRATGAAPRPMNSVRPMSNPNAAASAHLRSRTGP
jgi:hypothetical protein